jgi:aryl-alcohol dehydrogenase-like predicted oxidoreductase
VKDFASREEIVLASKVGRPMGQGPNRSGLSRKHIMQSIDASLRRLGTDYLDLYIIHRFDDETSIEETLEALNDVVRMGKALYLGASAMLAGQLARMLSWQREHRFARFISMQNYYNLIYREEEREMLPLCAAEGVAVTPFSPLARGFLAGNASREGARTRRAETDSVTRRRGIGSVEEDHVIAGRVAEIAVNRGVSRAAVALSWLLSKPVVAAPVLGVSRSEQLDDALAAIDLVLDAEVIRFLEEPYRPKVLSGLKAFGVR